MTQDSQGYNGWSNYATWGVALVLDNERGSREYIREAVEQFRAQAEADVSVADGIVTAEQKARYLVADWLRDYVEVLCGLDGDEVGEPMPSLMARQVIQAGLAEVDWAEIAANVLAES